MSISKQNLTAIIVSFKSHHVIEQCINSIDQQIKIIVIDNTNDEEFKEYLESKFLNLKCILSTKNLGMGTANNLGIKNTNTDYALILNPDVVLESNAIHEIINASANIKEFGLIAPICSNQRYPNYNLGKKYKFNSKLPFEVMSVDGYAMLLNLKKLKQLNNFSFFDENIFLYLENDDLCAMLKKNDKKIFVIPTSKINHLGGKAVDPKYEKQIELSRNWHWMWSKFYFNKKHYGYFYSLLFSINNFFSALIKLFFYSVTFRNYKRKIYQMRLLGLLNSIIGNKSYYRPTLKD